MQAVFFKLMRGYWNNKASTFVLDLWNGEKGVELHFYRPEWDVAKVNIMKKSFNTLIFSIKSITEWYNVFDTVENEMLSKKDMLKNARDTLHKMECTGTILNNLSMEQIKAVSVAEFAIDELLKMKGGETK